MNTTMNWSEEQIAIFNFYAQGTGNLVIEALAGTGKTTTIKEAFGYVHPDIGRILYAVFNKRNQREASEKIKDSRVEVLTLHALGYRFVKKVWTNAKPDDQVEIDRVAKYIPAQDKELIGLTCKLVSLAKNTHVDPSTEDLCDLCEEYDVDFGTTERKMSAVQACLRVLADSKVKDPAGRISFNDMVWLPVAMNLVRPTYDLVTVDEAQDMNALQLMMARSACKVTGRVIIVGDSRQAIYGFRGAVQDGMNMMKQSLQADTLSLTTTYRCPRLVVQEAARLVPAYKAAPEAPEGVVTSVGSVQNAQVGDAILSRLNAPLMPLALSFLRKGIPARIEGRDIGKQLVGMIKGLKAATIEDLLTKIQKWEAKQIARLQDSRNAEKKIEVVQDTADTLQAICADCETVADAEQKIAGLFQDTDEKSRPAIVLSSVHKAKGLEWKRVFLLQQTFRASRGGEEENILYVALTRAMRELYLVGAGQDAPQAAQAKNTQAPAENVTTAQESAIPTPLRSGPPPRKIDSNKVHVQPAIFDSTDLVPGCRLRVVGEVVTLGEKSYVVEKVNGSGATCRNLRNASDMEHISRSVGTEVPVVLEENFQLVKPEPKGNKHNPGKKENTSMSKKDETIEILISKAIAMGKDDNKITMACMSNYPDVPAAEVIKLIAKGRKAAGKAPAPATPPARKPKAEAAPKKERVDVKQAGAAQTVRDLCNQGLSEKNARAKAVETFPLLAQDVHWCGRWATALKLKAAAKEAGKTTLPPKKAASRPAASVKAPPVRKSKAAAPEAEEPAAAETDVPAQGEEVPQE